MPASGQAWAARAFFVWASVTNLLVVSIAWGSLAGRFTSDQAHRLFGFIAAGGTLGAIAGSSLAGVLAVRGRAHLADAARVPGSSSSACWPRAVARPHRRAGLEPSRFGRCDDSSPPVVRPSRQLYLAGLGLWTLLFTTSSAIRLHGAGSDRRRLDQRPGRPDRVLREDRLAGQRDGPDLAGLLVTGRILALLGAGGSAAMLPAVTLVGAIVLALRPTVATVQWFQVVRRAVDYAIARPSREVFYTVVDRAELSRTKGLIDTAVYRAGDAAGAWAYGLLAALPGLVVGRAAGRRPALALLDRPQPLPGPRPPTPPRPGRSRQIMTARAKVSGQPRLLCPRANRAARHGLAGIDMSSSFH